jgi:hypothetical protein
MIFGPACLVLVNGFVNARRAAVPAWDPIALLAADPEPPDAALRVHAGLRPRCGRVRWMLVDEQAGLRKYRQAPRRPPRRAATAQGSGGQPGDGLPAVRGTVAVYQRPLPAAW